MLKERGQPVDDKDDLPALVRSAQQALGLHPSSKAPGPDGSDAIKKILSSKIPALERAGFRELTRYARPGDRLTVSELYRLCRDLADILALRAWCQQHQVKLHVLSGALSNITDLAATDATTTMLVNVLVSVGQFQRDLQTNSPGKDWPPPGRPAAPPAGAPGHAQLGLTDQIRQAYRDDGVSIAALARGYGCRWPPGRSPA